VRLEAHWIVDDLDLLCVALDCAKAVEFLHSFHPPIVHRDVKSLNFLVSRHEGRWIAKVCDLELSSEEVSIDNDQVPDCPFWMAPEVLCGTPFSPPSDIYALGIVFWEMFSGSPMMPFQLEMEQLSERSGTRHQIKELIINGSRPSWPQQTAQGGAPTTHAETPCAESSSSAATASDTLSTREQLQLLCADMWHANPDARPSAATIVLVLQRIVEAELQQR
jgi:serine/threonine protein kinase